jgi:CIC family chloride channel protein
MILKEGVVLSFSLQQPFNYNNVPYYIVMGILAGLVSVYYARAFTWTEKHITKVRNGWARAITGGLLLFVLLILFPPLFGEGYETIKTLSDINPGALAQTSVLKNMITNEA